MIAFLLILYLGVLAILVKLKVIKLNTFWKLSPVLWLIVLLIALFIPMQWGAPSGAVTMYQYVLEITPNVSGPVVEVPVKPLVPVKEGDVLFKIDARPFQYQLDQLTAERKQTVAQMNFAKIEYDRNLNLAKESAAAQRSVDEWRARYQEALAGIDSIDAQMDSANWNLEQTTVHAPSDGYVIGLSLLPGQRVTTMPMQGMMAFVESRTRLAMGVNQNTMRYVEVGQPAEVVFKLYPGKTFNATVESIALINPQGQLAPSGKVPTAPTGQQSPLPYGVILALSEDSPDLPKVPGGALGTAAIYTDAAKQSQVIRRVMMRMQTWINYISPY